MPKKKKKVAQIKKEAVEKSKRVLTDPRYLKGLRTRLKNRIASSKFWQKKFIKLQEEANKGIADAVAKVDDELARITGENAVMQKTLTDTMSCYRDAEQHVTTLEKQNDELHKSFKLGVLRHQITEAELEEAHAVIVRQAHEITCAENEVKQMCRSNLEKKAE